MSKNDGGSAFPVNDPNKINPMSVSDYEQAARGISVRDYFAAKAMQGICAQQETWGCSVGEIAKNAYKMADLMLAERAQ